MTTPEPASSFDFHETSINLNKYFSNNSNRYQFPWSLSQVNLKAYDFFRIIELFIKAATLTSSTAGTNNHSLPSKSILLDREIIKYLSSLEELVLESLAWQQDSPMWSHLNVLKVDEAEMKAFSSIPCQSKYSFPLYEDVTSQSLLSTQPVLNSQTRTLNSANGSLIHNGGSAGAPLNGELILNLTPNPVTSSVSSSIIGNSYSSPVKHPTITRVVCSTNGSGVSSINETISSRKLMLYYYFEASISKCFFGLKIRFSCSGNCRK